MGNVELSKSGVSNSRPSQPFSAARERIPKLLMNFGSIATDHRRTNVWSPDHRPHLRGTNFCHSEITLLMLERWRPFFFGDRSYFRLHFRDRCPEKWWSPNLKLHAALGTIAHICNVAPRSPRVWHPWYKLSSFSRGEHHDFCAQMGILTPSDDPLCKCGTIKIP